MNIELFRNIERQTRKNIDLVGKCFDTVDDLRSEIALITAEAINSSKSNDIEYIKHKISVDVSNEMKRLRNNISNSNIVLISLNDVEDKLIVDYSDLEHYIFAKEILHRTCYDETYIPNDRYRSIMKHRYVDDLTYEEIGKLFGVNKERVRQIVCKVERMLRHPSRINRAKNYRKNVDENIEISMEEIEKRGDKFRLNKQEYLRKEKIRKKKEESLRYDLREQEDREYVRKELDKLLERRKKVKAEMIAAEARRRATVKEMSDEEFKKHNKIVVAQTLINRAKSIYSVNNAKKKEFIIKVTGEYDILSQPECLINFFFQEALEQYEIQLIESIKIGG